MTDQSCSDLTAKLICEINPPNGTEYDGPLDWVPSYAMDVDEFI